MLVKKQKPQYTELYGFASDKSVDSIPNYIENIDILERFILYFYDRAYSLIERASRKSNRLMIPEDFFVKEAIEVSSLVSCEARKEFFRSTEPYNIYLSKGMQEICCSKREIECLLRISQGYSAKETSALLNISSRTVEKHLQNVKTKLGCYSRGQLREVVLSNELKIKWLEDSSAT